MKSYFNLCFGVFFTFTSIPTVAGSAPESENTANNTTMEEPLSGIKRKAGYFYDGAGCWIYGVWVRDTSSGASMFFPGSAANQALNNVCGWDDVAHQQPEVLEQDTAEDIDWFDYDDNSLMELLNEN